MAETTTDAPDVVDIRKLTNTLATREGEYNRAVARRDRKIEAENARVDAARTARDAARAAVDEAMRR